MNERQNAVFEDLEPRHQDSDDGKCERDEVDRAVLERDESGRVFTHKLDRFGHEGDEEGGDVERPGNRRAFDRPGARGCGLCRVAAGFDGAHCGGLEIVVARERDGAGHHVEVRARDPCGRKGLLNLVRLDGAVHFGDGEHDAPCARDDKFAGHADGEERLKQGFARDPVARDPGRAGGVVERDVRHARSGPEDLLDGTALGGAAHGGDGDDQSGHDCSADEVRRELLMDGITHPEVATRSSVFLR